MGIEEDRGARGEGVIVEMFKCSNSTQVIEYGYERRTEEMRVRFTNGALYSYVKVPEEVFVAFLHAASKGRFIKRHIAGNYDYELVEGPP